MPPGQGPDRPLPPPLTPPPPPPPPPPHPPPLPCPPPPFPHIQTPGGPAFALLVRVATALASLTLNPRRKEKNPLTREKEGEILSAPICSGYGITLLEHQNPPPQLRNPSLPHIPTLLLPLLHQIALSPPLIPRMCP